MTPTLTVTSSFPLLNIGHHPTFGKDLSIHQSNNNWDWLPIMERRDCRRPVPASSTGSDSHFSDSVGSDSNFISASALMSSTSSLQTLSHVERKNVLEPTTSRQTSTVINTSYICQRLGLSSSIFSHEDLVKCESQYQDHGSVPTTSFVYSHDRQIDTETRVADTSNMDGFETIDLTAENQVRWSASGHSVLCDQSRPDESPVIATDYQVVAIPPQVDDGRKRKFILALTITSVVVVVIVVIVTVLMTYWLNL